MSGPSVLAVLTFFILEVDAGHEIVFVTPANRSTKQGGKHSIHGGS